MISASSTVFLIGVLQVALGLSLSFLLIPSTTLLQEKVGQDVMGQVFSTFNFCIQGAGSLSLAIMGVLVGVADLRLLIMLSGISAIVLAGGGAGLRRRLQ